MELYGIEVRWKNGNGLEFKMGNKEKNRKKKKGKYKWRLEVNFSRTVKNDLDVRWLK